jgi:hypothetical protein
MPESTLAAEAAVLANVVISSSSSHNLVMALFC